MALDAARFASRKRSNLITIGLCWAAAALGDSVDNTQRAACQREIASGGSLRLGYHLRIFIGLRFRILEKLGTAAMIDKSL